MIYLALNRGCYEAVLMKNIPRTLGVKSIPMDAIVLWKNANNFQYLFTNLDRFLTGATEEPLGEGDL
jgi:hypothetical protein